MDTAIQKEIDDVIASLKQATAALQDPVSKLMVAALCHQAQKIKDELACVVDNVVDRLCAYFIPQDKINAMPALCLLRPVLKSKKSIAPHQISGGTYFTYKYGSKQQLSYYPLYSNVLLPYTKLHLVTPTSLKSCGDVSPVMSGKQGQVWIGIELDVEVESLCDVSFFIKGTGGALPQRILVGNDQTELSFCKATELESIPMLEPFDAQQSLTSFFGMLTHWKNVLADNPDGTLVYITDDLVDRDVFKGKAFPKIFQQTMESSDLDRFSDNTLWILFDFGPDFMVPEDTEIELNVVPAVNVAVNNVTLTQSAPIAKLTKDDNSFFLKVTETTSAARRQGFDMNDEGIVIRDFDASTYNSASLYRDVRRLYHHFIDDYYAFVDYHAIKDGEMLKTLRDTINKIGKSVLGAGEVKDAFDSGVYAMRNVNLSNQSTSIKVSYLTTFGRTGNTPASGEKMENKKDAALEKDVVVVSGARGGEDRVDYDCRYQMLRYYLMTSDRLFTKMDIDAFLRIQLLKEFGQKEMKRISYEISIMGAPGDARLVRGLYIDVTFKDAKNHSKAISTALDSRLHQMILDKSCLSMPVFVNLFCEE